MQRPIETEEQKFLRAISFALGVYKKATTDGNVKLVKDKANQLVESDGGVAGEGFNRPGSTDAHEMIDKAIAELGDRLSAA